MDETPRRNRYLAAAVCGLLLLMAAIVFAPTVQYDFVNFDDAYVYNNPHVACGLSGEGIAWSFTTFHACNWHPVTWLSHALDCQLYGTQHPGLHHLTNVVLHTAVAILLLLVLWQMTGSLCLPHLSGTTVRCLAHLIVEKIPLLALAAVSCIINLRMAIEQQSRLHHAASP